MPELPEVQMMADLFLEVGEGQVLTQIETCDHRIWGECEPLESMGQISIARRGKVLVVQDEQRALLIHLRMTGQIRREADHRAPRMVFTFENAAALVLLDQRCLAQIEWVERSQLERAFERRRIGQEFWPHQRSGKWWCKAMGDRTTSIKSALLEQHRVTGIGNIAASELLWRAQIPPDLTVRELEETQWDDLARAADAHVHHCLSRENADTLRFVTSGGPNFFKVYGREGEACPRCKDPILRTKQSGRATFFCAKCQY